MIGAHLSKTNYQKELGITQATIFQIFISNPRSYQGPSIEDIIKFGESDVPVVIHLPYLVNFASERDDVRINSLNLYHKTMKNLVGNYFAVVVHGGQGGVLVNVEDAINRWVDLFKDSKSYKTKLLVENTAGGNAAPGKNLSDLVILVKELRKMGHNVGVCYDTCHAWAAGGFGLVEGYNYLKKELGAVDLIHFNDSKDTRGSARDRHELLNNGLIPFETLIDIARLAKKDGVPLILETPGNAEIWSNEILLLDKA